MEKKSYIQLNNSYKHALTYSFENLGFYSNFNNMVLTMAYCLKYKLRFRVYCKDNSLFTPKGWNSLFLPMDFETKNPFFAHFNYRRNIIANNSINDRIHDVINRAYPLITGNNLVNSVFSDTRTYWFRYEHFNIPELGFEGGLQELCHELIGIIYQFNDEVRNNINKYKSSIELPEHYVSMQVRRGDKDTERELQPISTYMEKLLENTEQKNVFVLTDDFSVVEELRNSYKNIKFYTLTSPTEHGFYYTRGTSDNKEMWIKLFASMEIICGSELFVGTVSANPGMFIGMAMEKGKSLYVDSQDWIIL